MTETELTDETFDLRLRRSEERALQDLGWSRNHLTFSFADYHDSDWMGFGPLRVLIESHIDPNEGFSEHPHRNVEIISYVTSGELQHRDSYGHEASISEGEMQLISAGQRGMIHSERNPRDEPESHYQLWLVPDRPNTDFAYHELGYTAAERQGRFRLYVSPDGRGDSMPTNADAYIYAGRFSPGDAVSHRLEAGRGAWVQVVRGRVEVAGVTLRTGDGAGIVGLDPLDVSVEEESEVLLVDVRREPTPEGS